MGKRAPKFQPKEGEIYDISSILDGDPSGIRKLTKGVIHLQGEHEYFLGASSSPDLIVVSRVTDEWVYFYSGDFRKERREQRPIADDLIARGTKTWVGSYGKLLETRGAREGVPEERIAFVAALRGLLAGKPSPLKHSHIDHQRVKAEVRQAPGFVLRVVCPKCGVEQPVVREKLAEHEAGYAIMNPKPGEPDSGRERCPASGQSAGRDGDLWNRAEQYGGVGSHEAYSFTIYSIHGRRASVVKVKDDPAFKVISIVEDE